ncbi:hypothetical protein D3C81_2250060 [compost metagenome]
MDHVDYTAFDKDTEHRVQGGVPAFEEAQAQNDQPIQHKQNGAHRNVALARNDGAQNIESPR